jgi:hypothetical protein
MPIRESMTGLVSRLRSITGAALDDEFHGVTYWSDEQLEAELDKVRYPAYALKLTKIERKIDGSCDYSNQTFNLLRGYWVEDLYTIRDTSGNEVSSPLYTVAINEQRGQVTFESNPGSGCLTIDLYVYDWNAAAAAVWEQKAAHRFDYLDVKAGDHKINHSDEYKNCVNRARWHSDRKAKSFQRTPARFIPDSRNRW